MKRNVRNAVVFLAAGGVVTVVACSFPQITFTDGGGTGGTGGATEASSSAGTGVATTATTSTGSQMTGGSSSASGTSSSGTSSSASGSSSTSTSASSSGTVGDGGCTTDDDHDTYLSWTCDLNTATQDCADEDARAHPGGGFGSSPITGAVKPGTLPYDFDCDGSETQETPVVTCGLGCNGSIVGYQSAVACGDSAPVGQCGALCSGWTATSPTQIKVQRCK